MGIQKIYPADPEIITIKKPSLFAAEWQKIAFTDDFSEYINPSRLERNFDSTVEVITMRNYFNLQTDNYEEKDLAYKSYVSYETIDCFNHTVTINKIFLLSDSFASGSLVEEPIEPLSRPIQVTAQSIGFSKVSKVCKLADIKTDMKLTKDSFMTNI